jgi:hypothetical protein
MPKKIKFKDGECDDCDNLHYDGVKCTITNKPAKRCNKYHSSYEVDVKKNKHRIKSIKDMEI